MANLAAHSSPCSPQQLPQIFPNQDRHAWSLATGQKNLALLQLDRAKRSHAARHPQIPQQCLPTPRGQSEPVADPSSRFHRVAKAPAPACIAILRTHGVHMPCGWLCVLLHSAAEREVTPLHLKLQWACTQTSADFGKQ